MKKQIYLVLAAFLTILNGVYADGGPDILKLGPQPSKPAEHLVGRRIENFAFMDLDGKTGKLSDYAGYDAVVIAMNVVDCPICRRFAAAFKKIQTDYEAQKVAFLMVNGNDQATLADLRKQVAQLGFKARYIPDLDHGVASEFGALSSSEVFILDRAQTLVYRGPVSDQFGIGYSLAAARNEYLRDALDAVLRQGIVKFPSLTAPGCALGISTSSTKPPTATFNNRISRIIQYNCQSCHRAGEAAPFPLVTYGDIKGHSGMIRYVVDEKIMPPWYADPAHGNWANDASLTAEDRDALLDWIKAKMPLGNATDAPLARKWPLGLEIGKPDLSYSIPKAISVPDHGVIPYQYIIVDSALKEDAWVTGMEILSPHPELLHHVLVFVRPPEAIATSPHDGNGDKDEILASRVPGSNAFFFPQGLARRVPKGSQFVFQIHITPNGVAGEVNPKLLLKTSPAKNLTEIHSLAVVNKKFVIPAGDSNYQVEATIQLPFKLRLMSFIPHMHLRGKAFRFEAIYPDGRTEILLDVPKYDFNWQLRYTSAAPVDLPIGTTIKGTAWYDNSADNPANPDPTIDVRWGEQTTDEMMIGFMEAYALK